MKRTGMLRDWVRRQLESGKDRPTPRQMSRVGRHTEALENRWLLVSNIVAQFAGNDLYLSGGSDADAVQMMVVGSSVVLRGLNGSTVNGSTDDFVVRTGSTLAPGNVFVDFNGGNDTFAVANGAGIRGGCTVNLGEGDDTFAMQNASVGNTLSVNLGAGNNSLSTLTVDIVREAFFTSEGGNDVFSLKSTVVGRTLDINSGAGNDSIVIEGTGGTQRVIGKTTSIQMGDGNDNFVSTNGMFCRDFFLDMGAGDDFVRSSGCVFRKNVTVLLGSGDDNVVTSGANGFSLVTTIIGQGGTDNVEVSAGTIVRHRNTIDVDSPSVSDALETDRLNNATTGAQTLATQLQQRVAALVALPALTVAITPTTLAENAGAGTISGTVSRPTTGTSAITVLLNSSDNTELTVPSSVTIPAGQTSATFNINAVDDNFVDGNITVTITASLTGFSNGTDTISVTDNETGPAALTVSLNPTSILESAGANASTATVTRNTDPAAALVVTLTSADTTEATVPATVTIPAGQTSITFPIAAVDDTTSDGNIDVVITASATGVANGTATLTVQDSEIQLQLDTSGNTNLLQSNGTLLTKSANLTVGGTTAANATVDLDVDGDGFDDGSTTANASGVFSMIAALTNTTTNRGANPLRFRARPATGTGETIQSLDVHRAVGSVTRFTSSLGTFDVELLDTAAPITVANFKSYFSRYTNSIIHRSPSDFVIQGGGFTANNGTVTAVTTDAAITNEFNSANSNVRGTLSLALLGGQPNSGTSGWFINVVDNSFLNSAQHTVFGRVIGTGMDIVDAINSIPIFNLNPQLNGGAFGELPLIGNIPFEDLAGTVSVAAGSAVVTGVGTSFTTALTARSSNVPGSTIRIGGQNFEVLSIQSNTQVTLTSTVTTAATNVTAQRHADPLQSNYIVFSSIGEILNGGT